jgi:hypothetical protein
MPFHQSPAREEAVIRERFPKYRRLLTRVVTTMQPVQAVAHEIVGRLAEQRTAAITPVEQPVG